MKLRITLIILFVGIVGLLIVEFMPTPTIEPLSNDIKIGVWMGVTWSMDEFSDNELEALANDLQARGVDYAFVYVSYLQAGDTFNMTYDHAANFTRRMKTYAPDVALFAWVGVPISITQPDGTEESNRLARPEIRQQIADFARFTVTDLGFDGFHLNAEILHDKNRAFIETLRTIRAALPDDAILSTTSHGLRVPQSATLIPYPNLKLHASTDFLQEMAQYADQITLMAYDSGLPFPRDYRAWVQYQTATSAAALADTDVELLIGLPASEEWTPSHQTQAETIANGLYGFRQGYNEGVDGIALYPYWELSPDEWRHIQALQNPAND